MTTNKLIEQHEAVQVQLVERKDEAGVTRVYARGEFGRADKPTANKRLYPHEVWESQITRLKENLKGRKVLGELDHPDDGRTSLKRVSHVLTSLRLEGDLVVGEAEILDTDCGRNLKALLAGGVPVGISSRGYGSTKPHTEGYEVVQKDYKLVTFDFVAEPADQTAYPEVFFEGVELPAEGGLIAEGNPRAPQVSSMSDKEIELAKRFVDVASKAEPAEADLSSLRAEFQKEVLTAVAGLKQQAMEDARQQLLADPEVAGAKTALEAIKDILRPYVLAADAETVVSDKEEQIRVLSNQIAEMRLSLAEKDDQIEQLSEAAKEAGYRFFLETQLPDRADAAILRKMVGDVSQYESVEALKAAIDSAELELAGRRKVVEDEKARLKAHEETVRAEADALREDLEAAKRENRELRLQAYAESKLTSHPKAAKIRDVLENTELTSKTQIDAIMENYRTPERSADEVDRVRSRVRERLSSGRGPANEAIDDSNNDTAQRTVRRAGDYNGLGVGLDELKTITFGNKSRN